MKNEPRIKVIPIRFTEAEWDKIKGTARGKFLYASAWIRQTILKAVKNIKEERK